MHRYAFSHFFLDCPDRVSSLVQGYVFSLGDNDGLPCKDIRGLFGVDWNGYASLETAAQDLGLRDLSGDQLSQGHVLYEAAL